MTYTCLLSGGKDSVTTAHLCASRGEMERCVFIDTGIATPDALPFVLDLCAKQGWPLEVFKTPVVYEDFVMKYGFPGPSQHSMTMNYLKGRAIRALRKAHPQAILASGVRRLESARRLRNVKPSGTFEGLPVVAPISNWPTEKVWDYLARNDLKISPAYKTLHLSGDCLCGAYAHRSEVGLIKMFYPEVAARIARLEASITRPNRRTWGWGEGFAVKQTSVESFVCGACAQ